jgi:protein-S-isoprenylcysteine O-methyltransferase Ste14
VVGLLLRNLALYTARSNFNHLVQTTKAPTHRLVTHGVYAYDGFPLHRLHLTNASSSVHAALCVCVYVYMCILYVYMCVCGGDSWTRHPSYAGFFWYSLGTQVLLANPLTLVVYVGALYAFFIPRIRYPPLSTLHARAPAVCIYAFGHP